MTNTTWEPVVRGPTEDDIRSAFESTGKVSSVSLIMDQDARPV